MKLKNYNDGRIVACECGGKKFRTVEKNHLWACRKCGQLRAYIKPEEENIK